MANIPVDGNEQSLLSTRIGRGNPQKYINFNIASYSTFRCAKVREFNRAIYILTYLDSTYRLYLYNLLNHTSRLLYEANSNISSSDIEDFIIDEDGFMYISRQSYQSLRVVNLNTQEVVTWSYSTGKNPICYAKLSWIDPENFIMLDAGPNLLKFNVKTRDIVSIPMTGGATSGDDYCIGEKYIFTTKTKYDIENGTASTYTLPNSSAPTSVAYDNGKYYFALTNALYYYDEATDTWSSEISVGWSTPIELRVHNGLCYAMNNNSSKAYLYDLNESIVHSFLMRWTIPNRSNYRTRADMFRGMWMIAANTLCYIMYDNILKYNIGPVTNHIKLLFNTTTESDYTYDERFIEFTDTYVTIHDGNILYPDANHGLEIETISEDRGIYGVSVSKSDYNILNKAEAH